MQVFKKSFIEDEQIKEAVKKRCLPRSSDLKEVKQARTEFKELCEQIKTFAELDTFKGSFEEVNQVLKETEAETPEKKIEKLELLVAWLIKNAILVHESERVGLFSPELFTKMYDEPEELVVEETPVIEESSTIEENK